MSRIHTIAMILAAFGWIANASAADTVAITDQPAIEQAENQDISFSGKIREAIWSDGRPSPGDPTEYLILRFEGTDSFGLVLNHDVPLGLGLSIDTAARDLVGRTLWADGRVTKKHPRASPLLPPWYVRKSAPFGLALIETDEGPDSGAVASAAKSPLQGDPVATCEGFSNTDFDELNARNVEALCGQAAKVNPTAEVVYQLGRGLARYGPHRVAEARTWYQKAADQGLVKAMYAMGLSYEFENATRIDYASAMRWYHKAAAHGYEPARIQIAYWTHRGIKSIGMNPDPKAAFRMYQDLANEGSADAQYGLGVYYEEGLGVVRIDFSRATSWYRKAADQGHAAAQNALGAHYHYSGGYFPTSYEKAEYWYQKSADQGFELARANLKRLKSEIAYRNRRRSSEEIDAELAREYETIQYHQQMMEYATFP